jgi:ABC-type uncharacterized transport system substrate-binding protein
VAEVIRSKVDVVVAFGPELALKAALAASQTIPIVMIAVNFDPIAGGYVSTSLGQTKTSRGWSIVRPNWPQSSLNC